MEELTKRQENVLEFIESYYTASGCAPTFSEIADNFKFRSLNAVTDYVAVLHKKGYIGFEPGKSRAIVPKRVKRLTKAQQRPIPIVGAIAAGKPIDAIENIETDLDLQQLGFTNAAGDKFALRVKGDSMVGRGIRDGDIVVVKKQKTVNANDVAVVRMGNEATLKYVRKDNDHVFLVPDNPAMEPFSVAFDSDFEILGKTVGLVRKTI